VGVGVKGRRKKEEKEKEEGREKGKGRCKIIDYFINRNFLTTIKHVLQRCQELVTVIIGFPVVII
jgi:hypothetical protein